MIVDSRCQGKILPQEDRAPLGQVALLRRKNTVFGVWLWNVVLLSNGTGVKAHRRMEYSFVVYSDESLFCLSASDGCELVKRWPGERLYLAYLRPRLTGPTPEVVV
ncbi:DDE_3 domain-containing protein [Trichonephila clavipes]|nr:DDE_3 domain-containing protein [Trichonephila clavipes]